MTGEGLVPHRLDRRRASEAAAVLVRAFAQDRVWQAVFGEETTPSQIQAGFELPVVYCCRYGEVWATSPAVEGVAAWVPGRFARMTTWRLLCSRAILSGLRMGSRLGKKMGPIFQQLEEDRERHMTGRDYTLLEVFGVEPTRQGQGLGGGLLRALSDRCDREGLALYLDTETERNVCMYQRFGFRVLREITLPVVDMPAWEMIREPGS